MDQTQLDGIWAKLARADEHLEALQRAIKTFSDSQPNSYWPELDLQAGLYSIRVTLEKPPPARLAVICGDYVHALRSTLDHLVCGLVRRPTNRTAFPIFIDPDEFLCSVVLPAKRKRLGPLTGIDPMSPLFAFIESAQPYKGGDELASNALYILRELSNTDKHRAILAQVAAHTVSADLRVIGDGLIFIGKAEYTYDKPLVDGAEVVKGRFETPVQGEPKVEVQGDFPVDVAFGKDILVPSASLESLKEAVVQIVRKTRPLHAASKPR